MKALIVDDELLAGEYLEELVKAYCPEITQLINFTSPLKALEEIRNKSYDLVFLDVEMPEMDCFEFIDKASFPQTTAIIITTAYAHYAVKAFKTKAIHYLLKPIETEELIAAVQRVKESNTILQKAQAKLREEEKKILVKSVLNGEEIKVTVNQIKFIKAAGDYVELFVNEEKILIRATMKSVYLQLEDTEYFERVHKSYIANLKFVTRFDKEHIQISTHYLPISRSKRSFIKEYFDSITKE